MTKNRKLEMNIDLSALDHLGINLYSNVPSVLSEIVANSWDADATEVEINLDTDLGQIIIKDNGTGMRRDEVIDYFLTVGFRRRDKLGERTPKGRLPMGRKGIGKLSIFSVARLASVYTTCDQDKTAFEMNRDRMKEVISENQSQAYNPTELSCETELQPKENGTTIVLAGLSKSLTGMTSASLKRRVARRFSIIGEKYNFKIKVDGDEITIRDRGYHNAIQYLWTYGEQKTFSDICKNLSRDIENRDSDVADKLKESGLTLTGWIGTAEKPKDLKDPQSENLNRIAIFMRGKLAQEDILNSFAQKGIYADYIIGELHCDELDSGKDIATSSRQAIKEDDERFVELRNVVLSELRYISGKWSDWRNEDGAKKAQEVPEVKKWLEKLQGDTKKDACRWIGRLNTISGKDDQKSRKELLKASILAFESYRRKEELKKLKDVKDESLEYILDIFRNIDSLEMSYYGQIVQGRLGVIDTLRDKLDDDSKELVIRDYIFDHLWLLDPSWERADGTSYSESNIEKYLKGTANDLSDEERRARIDIGYRTVSGKNVIIELKRKSVKIDLDKLVAQVRKYRSGVKKILKTSRGHDNCIDIICLLGSPPVQSGGGEVSEEDVESSLKAVDARVLYYDQVLERTMKAYNDYIVAKRGTDKLREIFDAIDDFSSVT